MAEENEAPTKESTETESANERPLSLLAQERFGDQYKRRDRGQVDTAPEQEEVEDAEASGEEEEPEASEAENEDQVEESAESDSDSESESESETESEEEGEPISSFSELVEHNEWDPEWAQSLKVGVKVDGEQSEVPLSDLISNYQMDQAADKRLEDAKQKAKSLMEETSERQKAAEERFATAGTLIESVEKMINEESSSVNWAKLREDDPAEYAAKKADLEEKREKVERMKREAVEAYRKGVSDYQAQTEEQKQQKLQEERAKLIERVPEWADEKVAAKEQPKVLQFLQNSGFSGEELNAIASDHRAVILARNAMLYDETKSKTDAAKKKVAKIPKVMKGGTPKPKETAQRQKIERVQKRFKKNRDLDSAMAYLRATRSGG